MNDNNNQLFLHYGIKWNVVHYSAREFIERCFVKVGKHIVWSSEHELDTLIDDTMK